MGCSTFANFTVLPEIALAHVRQDAPFDKICYIGCGVTTGIGAVMYTAGSRQAPTWSCSGSEASGSTSCRGPGWSARTGSSGSTQPGARGAGRAFGMTHFVNPRELKGELVPHLVELSGGGADYSFECIGNTQVMRQALECCHRGWGQPA